MRWEVVEDVESVPYSTRLSRELQRILQQELSGRFISHHTGADVWNCVYSILAEMPGVERRAISFSTVIAHGGGEITVEPSNLYTGLLLAGHVMPASGLQYNYDDEVTMPEGTYAFRDGEFMFRPNRPPEWVEVTIDPGIARILGYNSPTRWDVFKSFVSRWWSRLPGNWTFVVWPLLLATLYGLFLWFIWRPG